MAILFVLRKIWGNDRKDDEPTVTEEELVSIIDTVEEEGVINEEQGELLQSTLEFSDTTIEKIMTPRIDVTAIDIDDEPEKLMGLLTDMTLAEWNHIFQTNLTSVFVICQKLLPAMIRRGQGKIINISSVWGNVGSSMEVAYSATKGGLNSFTKALAKEVAPSGVQVNAIACGLIDTDMNACFSEDDLETVIADIPADRIGKPEEVADLCLQLVQAPEYLTGQIIALDGGWI
jgi:3-oxoacyl-[acyl-carrier protein] reductase